MKTGNTETAQKIIAAQYTPQWSPVMKTGNTLTTSRISPRV